ncbi:meiosis-specific protein MEI4-like [Amphiura filiformis]|uniref:meiosis-specific protein MEI4-like n=1 Tax=Amphiura filiformis TaxID=82378 RepID=UPI003B21FFAB
MMQESSSGPVLENSSSEMNAAFIKRLKIAVATAIIRNKPSHMSAREYTENLARKLRQKENSWRGRVRKLEDELLKTRQELVLSRLQDAGIEINVIEDFDWNHHGTEGESQETEHPASCNGTDLVFPTPPCSSDDNQNTHHHDTTLKNNALFLHSISQLKSIPECHRKDINETVFSTALTAIHHVEIFTVDNCHSEWNHGKVLKEAVKGIVGLFDVKDVGDSQSLLDACERFAVKLLTSLVEHGGLNNNGYQQTICSLVTTLGRRDQLQPTILHMILNHLKRISSMLRRTQEGKQDLDCVLYENTFYLCSIFEDVVFDKGSDGGGLKSRLEGGMIVSLHDGLEDCLLHISREYPLYAQFIWRLTSALECLHVE